MTQEEYLAMLRKNHKKMLLNKGLAAEELGISEATLDRLRNLGDISSKKVLGRIMFSIDEIARFLADA